MKFLNFSRENKNSHEYKKNWVLIILFGAFIFGGFIYQIIKLKELSRLKKHFFLLDTQSEDQKKIATERKELSECEIKLQEKFDYVYGSKNNLFFILKAISKIIPYDCILEQMQYENEQKIIFLGVSRTWKAMNKFVRILTDHLKSKPTYLNTKKNIDKTLNFELHITI